MTTQNELTAERFTADWKALRRKTSSHNVGCDCRDCGERRKLGAKLQIPYAGDFKVAQLRPEFRV